MSTVKTIKAWADVGSHEHIFEFAAGPVAERYPHLLHIYSRPVHRGLRPILITLLERSKKQPDGRTRVSAKSERD